MEQAQRAGDKPGGNDPTGTTKSEEGSGQSDSRRSAREALREGWLAVLGAVSQAEEKGVTWLLDLTGVPHEQGGDVIKEITAHVGRNREALEKRVEEAVRTTAAKMRAPIEREVASLRARVEKLTARIDARRKKSPK